MSNIDAKEHIQKLIDKPNNDFEFRDFKINKLETRSEGDKDKLIIEGVAATFDTETTLYRNKYWEYTEIIERGAFNGADMSDVIFNVNHGGRVYARTRNNSLTLWVDDVGLNMRCELWGDDVGHKELYRDIQRGNIDKMSFAFKVKEARYETIERLDLPTIERRIITAFEKIIDVSAVDIPAYNTTEISARKVFSKEIEEYAERQKQQTESLEIQKRKLKLKFDSEV